MIDSIDMQLTSQKVVDELIKGSLMNQLPDKLKKGSGRRMLEMTHGSREEVVNRVNLLIKDFAEISVDDYWMPRGPIDHKEAELGKTIGFLSESRRKKLRCWWLAVRKETSNTPNWDFASTGKVKEKKGLILFEAKAHESELKSDGKSFDTKKSNIENHEKIGKAIEEANNELNKIKPGFNISRDKHYQLSNRFAWCWKVASLGIPVALVYLGFLNASEMESDSPIFKTDEDWEKLFRESPVKDVIPYEVWSKKINVNDTLFIPWLKVYPTS